MSAAAAPAISPAPTPAPTPAPGSRPALVDEPRWFLHNLVRIRVSGEQSGGTLGIVELTGTQGEMPPLHVHHREDETFVVLDGELSLHLPGETATLRAGQALLAPRGVPHSYRIESERCRWLCLSTPAGFAGFVTAASVPAEHDDLPPADRDVDMPALLAAAEAHGIAILGPPGLLP